jgi:NADH-quinone oxidoreductase subunit G
MPRPEVRMVTFSIDGREVEAPEGIMLADGAKHGDVEIPVFCYEPKLGNPVGACRMCLVEIEGIPKLQTACSTPVKDGMVVHTQTERVKEAQNSVVEFLLINHPLDCPVCDKGGECPLQDITFGWGRGISRMIEPKRHFKKPLELSPLVAIDRERCILCYRCVRFSQEVSEDYQLVLHERGAHSFVGTFDGHPYVAPFSGNIVELCPVGALTSTAYRFRARPWDVEGAGSVCALCPSQCNVTFTVRDERVLRVLARDHDGVDDGWLCDKGRFAYQAIHAEERVVEPLVRDGDELRPATWERALSAAAGALSKAHGSVAALAGGATTNEEGFLLQRLVRERLGSADLDCRVGGPVPLDVQRALAAPALQATVPDLEFAHAVLVLGCEPVDDAPILDLRIRKGVRRRGVKLAVASSRPSSLDPNADVVARYAPGGEHAFVAALDAALGGGPDVDSLARAAGAQPEEVRALAALLTGSEAGVAGAGGADARRAAAGSGAPGSDAPGGGSAEGTPLETGAGGSASGTSGHFPGTGEPGGGAAHETAAGGGAPAGAPRGDRDVVILWGERIGPAALPALLAVADRLGLAGRDGAGLLEVPAAANGRGLREAGVQPNAGPGLSEPAAGGRCAREIAQAAADGELAALYLLGVDPVREHADRRLWARALGRTATVIAHSAILTDALRAHATVVFPAESYAEKEGTVVHPDGRVQRLRQAIGRPGAVRAGWQVLAELEKRVEGGTLRITSSQGQQDPQSPSAQLFDAVPFYAGLTLEELGGKGVRWQERAAAEAAPAPSPGAFDAGTPIPAPIPNGALRLGTFRSIWAAPEVDASPALKFLAPRQQLELSPADAEKLGLRQGDHVRVGADGATVKATVALRANVPAGTVFLGEATAEDAAGELLAEGPRLVAVTPATELPAGSGGATRDAEAPA